MPLIGDRRTRYKIHASRTPDLRVEIPQGEILSNVRTSGSDVSGYPVPKAIQNIIKAGNPNIHIFEYKGETLYKPAGEGLMGATEPAES
ncbi:MAG TPA: hypothetical protein VKV79_02035 [Terriglobia bacterium]|nr:hypothetical protein [Terriglobia bacterium]